MSVDILTRSALVQSIGRLLSVTGYQVTHTIVVLTMEKEKILNVNEKINDCGNCISFQFHSLLEIFHLIDVCYLSNLSFEERAKDFSCIEGVIAVTLFNKLYLGILKIISH